MKLHDQSIADAQHAIDIYPYAGMFHNGLAIDYWQRNKPGDLQRGITIMHKAIELEQTHASIGIILQKGWLMPIKRRIRVTLSSMPQSVIRRQRN